jgi:hypothetical protein
MPVTSYKAGGTFGGNCQNPSNAAASDDVKTSHNNGNTLIVTNFDFGLPAGATIDGVECRVESSVNNSGTWTQVVDLYNASAAIGTSKSTTGITSLTDEVRSYGGAADVWSATLTQAIINGSGFGILITANRTTGIGSARFEVDFVEARVHYTEAAPPSELVGSSSGVATIAGVLSGIGSMIATAAGIATTAGVLSAIGKLVGSSSGIASASGTLEESSAPSLDRVRYTQHRDGQSGQLYGSFQRVAAEGIVGSSAGIATVTGTLTGQGLLVGSSAGVATVTGSISSGLGGSSLGTATVTGTLTGIGSLVGSSLGVATATGTLGSDTSLSGTAAGAATATGTLTGIGSISGSAAGVATVNGAIGSGLSGSTTGTATVTGTLTATGTLAGSVSGAATTTGTLFGSGRLIAAVTGTATTSGTLNGIGTLAGSVSGQATVTGRISGGTSGMIIQYYYHLAT